MGYSSKVRAGALYAQGYRFKSCYLNTIREVAQLVERLLWAHEAAGSSRHVVAAPEKNTSICGVMDNT